MMKFVINLFKTKYKIVKDNEGVYVVFERHWWEFEHRLIGTATEIVAATDLILSRSRK